MKEKPIEELYEELKELKEQKAETDERREIVNEKRALTKKIKELKRHNSNWDFKKGFGDFFGLLKAIGKGIINFLSGLGKGFDKMFPPMSKKEQKRYNKRLERDFGSIGNSNKQFDVMSPRIR